MKWNVIGRDFLKLHKRDTLFQFQPNSNQYPLSFLKGDFMVISFKNEINLTWFSFNRPSNYFNYFSGNVISEF